MLALYGIQLWIMCGCPASIINMIAIDKQLKTFLFQHTGGVNRETALELL